MNEIFLTQVGVFVTIVLGFGCLFIALGIILHLAEYLRKQYFYKGERNE